MKDYPRPPTRFSVLLGFLLLVPVIAGCVDGGQDNDAGEEPGIVYPPLGMGLDVPEELPELGPFVEDAADLAVLESFLVDEGHRILLDCGDPRGMESPTEGKIHLVEFWVQREQHIRAIDELILSCSEPLEKTRKELAQTAMEESREAEIQAQLHGEAVAAVQALRERLENQTGPSNAVEATLLHRITRFHTASPNTIAGAVDFWGYYENGTRQDELQLEAAYLGLLGAHGMSQGMQMILDRYPWENRPCQVDEEALRDRIQAKLDWALATAQEHALPGEESSWTALYGQLLMDTIPEFQLATENGWWWTSLAVEVRAEIHVAYWENRTQAEAWPTVEEAEYLLALHRNRERAILTEFNLIDFQWYVEDPSEDRHRDWHKDPDDGAVGLMGWLASRPAYTSLDCPA